MNLRVGLGWDLHRLVAGRPLKLGGVTIPHEKGLLGHSDGDVLLHAIADALLGAAGLPDIGELYPDTDDAYRGADSGELLAQVRQRVQHAGFEIVNVDAVVIAEAPKLMPYKTAMVERTARILGIAADRVNLKGKTPEAVGTIGAKEAIAAWAAVLLDEVRSG